ncbi:MAG TPA: alpha/beta fold hydrolase [Terracidiphilus sp.]|jgi:pimeloyl-ACP methyl ester carboxylesterase
MLEAIENRALLVLGGPGLRLQSTYHRPTGQSSDSSTSQSVRGRLGVLFVNSLSLPRAASGDSAVHWADSIAGRGYPAFRIDLPGLGDSDGNASTDLLDSINAGCFASVASAATAQLVERFGLTGMVIFGHCAGSVSAVYAAAASPECKGLILLDPYFHLPQAKRHKTREGLSEWARRSRVGRLLSNSYDQARNLRLWLRGNAPPGNANSPLLARWKQVAEAGMPILLLRAPGIKTQGAKPRVGEFDYIGHAVKLAGRKSRVSVEFVEDADHSFANRLGRAAVKRHIADWLVLHFPLAAVSMTDDGVSPARSGENQADARKPQTAPDDRRCALEGR